jgi:transposase
VSLKVPPDLTPGRAKTMTHDYKRNGTVYLFAALNVGTGEVSHRTRQRHTANDVLVFFKWIDVHVPQSLDVHVVLDNLSAHSAPPVQEWLEHSKRDRWHLHFTPTSSSWLNLVEGWFAQLTNRRLRHGSFDSVAALTEAIDVWASHWNDDPKPFIWHKTAKAIITKVRRGRAALTHQPKSATHHWLRDWSWRLRRSLGRLLRSGLSREPAVGSVAANASLTNRRNLCAQLGIARHPM